MQLVGRLERGEDHDLERRVDDAAHDDGRGGRRARLLPDPCTPLSKADVTSPFGAAPLRTLPQPPLVQTLLKSCAMSGE